MTKHSIFSIPFAKVYPLYIQKAERKKRTKAEVDQIICWLTGYDQAGLKQQIELENDFETFFAQAPAIHPNSSLIKPRKKQKKGDRFIFHTSLRFSKINLSPFFLIHFLVT
ncbi:hypothetical protein Q7A_2687 [Methylophaga nitratireducenticrescens]|uniref:DUF2200 domain-containing protein n=1 Tax=Methylophaga nitratireducenticrescens TaxID=754476 RepID=I1XM56_METNJ|nr:DUF2200 family protein [Methylophaga nitratireducenticrescens]AFI85475.1 hypothetical protein Q7A_2687 [Methylophaga nitratireducenticrescens]